MIVETMMMMMMVMKTTMMRMMMIAVRLMIIMVTTMTKMKVLTLMLVMRIKMHDWAADDDGIHEHVEQFVRGAKTWEIRNFCLNAVMNYAGTRVHKASNTVLKA
eukprot:5893800-Karenia_brevis.AAC.1